MATPADVLKLVKDGGFEFVDLRFCDLPGQVQHVSLPATRLDAESLEEGFGFDGSSIRGFQQIQESDMVLVPDPDTAVADPFRERRTLILYCFVKDPLTRQPYDKDPRYVAKKAEAYLAVQRHRRHLLLRARGRVLHLRLGPLRPEPALGVLLPRLGRGGLELGRRGAGGQPRLQAGVQGGLLPGPAHRPLPDLRSEMALPAAGGGRRRWRCTTTRWAPPASRDRHPLRHPAAHGRQRDPVQVHREEHRLAPRQDRHLHAQADLPGQRVGHARPP